MRRTIIILGTIIIAAGIGILIYLFLHRSALPLPATTGTGSLPNTPNQIVPSSTNPGQFTNPSSSTATGTAQTFGVISNDPAIDYVVDQKNIVTLIEPDGTIESVANGQPTILSSSTISDILSTGFSLDGQALFINFGDRTKPQTKIFNIAKKLWVSLPDGMISPSWSPSGYQIAFLNATTGSETIKTITINASSSAAGTPSALFTISAQDLSLAWVSKTNISLSDKASAYIRSSVWLFNIPNKSITPIAYDYQAGEGIFSNTTNTMALVFSGTSANQGGQLTLTSVGLGKNQALSFVSLPSKCDFHESTNITSTLDLYCAVPRDQDTLSVAHLPDEYDQKVFFTSDDFYKVNTASGILSTVFSDKNQNLDATHLQVFNNTLFFINRYDSKLYGVTLPTQS